MKSTSPRMKLAGTLAAALLATGIAGAQTSVFYSNTGSGSNAAAGGVTSSGNLASINFDAQQYNAGSGALSDIGEIAARPQGIPTPPALFQNYTAGALPTVLGNGEVLASVTLYLFADSIDQTGNLPGTITFTVYDGINGGGGAIRSLALEKPADENNFFSITLTAAEFLGGFSIGATTTGTQLYVSTEMSSSLSQTPGLQANYLPAVPEPSAVLLGAVGALGLLRRRRG